MGRIELFLIFILALAYLAVPVITLVLMVQINNRLKQIEQYLQFDVKTE